MSYLNWFGTTFLNAAGINRTSSMQSPTYDNPDWDAYSARIERYKYCESYYENAQYDALNSLGLQRRVYGKLYTNIRGIRNPVARLVNLYADKIYPAAIDTEDLSKGAIPILAPPEIKAALIQLFAWSNWSAGKQVYVRNGEKLGDSFIKVVDLVGNRRVALEVLAPQKVKDFTADVAGNIKQIVIEYPDHDPYPLPVYNQVSAPPVRFIRTEVITGTEVTVYRDGKVVERYSNPFGFVPVVHAKPRDEGHKFGSPRFRVAQSKIDESNSQAALLNDQVRKSIIAYLFTSGFKLDPASIQRTTTNMDEILTFSAPVDSDAKFLAPSLDIPAGLANLEGLLDEIRQDLPELYLYDLNKSTAVTGVGLRQKFDLSVAPILAAMSVYDDALMRACQMALTIGGMQQYAGFESFGESSYADGALAFKIRPRAVFEDGMADKDRINFLLQSGAPQRAIWKALDINEADMEEWAALLSEQNDALISQQMSALSQAQQLSVQANDIAAIT